MKIGLLSDTHSYLDPKVFDYFKNCDEIWHGGDIGDASVADRSRISNRFALSLETSMTKKCSADIRKI